MKKSKLFFCFIKNLIPKPKSNQDNTDNSYLMCVHLNHLYYLISKCPTKWNEHPTPDSSSKKGNEGKLENWHAKYTCRNWDKMSNYWEESSDKGIEKGILLKKFLRFSIFFLSDEKIFPILCNKGFSNVFSEYIICSSSYEGSKSSSQCCKKWVKSSIVSNPTSRNHNEFWWNRKKRWFQRHEEYNSRIIERPYQIKKALYQLSHILEMKKTSKLHHKTDSYFLEESSWKNETNTHICNKETDNISYKNISWIVNTRKNSRKNHNNSKYHEKQYDSHRTRKSKLL